MATRGLVQRKPILKANPKCPRDKEINILLLGQTGFGKSTFINAFANYIVNDTLEQAVRDEMQVVIPSSFAFTDPETFNEQTIVIGNENEYEQFKNVGHSNTQLCRSFVFPIGERNLRFIDTPGIGDTKGPDQDKINLQEILTYIAQYEHLNAIFIMLKPNEERLTVLFRFCINELLRHLCVSAKDNIVFVFTNARSTFFMPGSTKKLVETILSEIHKEHKVQVPFSMKNTFIFDNEAFRYLALRKKGLRVDNEQTQSYTRSWDHSAKEYSRLMEHINSCGLHAIRETLSLNEAEQFVRKLPRPIAETARLIEENIQLAKEHKKRVLENPQIASEGIPQNDAVIERLEHPQTVCMGEKCCRVTGQGAQKKVEYLSICHDICYIKGVKQETLSDPGLRECEVIDPKTGVCKVCNCRWRKHKHITYDCNTRLTHIRLNSTNSRTTNNELSLSEIDKRIDDLRNEKAQIEDIYKKLARFLHAKSISPINDDYVEYLRYFIREEQMKQTTSSRNTEVIANLEKMVVDFNNEMVLFKRIMQEQKEAGEEIEVITPDEVFALTGQLYRLPINGEQIRAQVVGIKTSQEQLTSARENFVELPGKAASSKVMLRLKDIVSSEQQQPKPQ